MLLAPGEPQEVEIVVRTLLLNATEMIPQIAESKKKTKPIARIATAILIQDFFNIHSTLLIKKMILSKKPFTCRLLLPYSTL